MKKYLYEDLYLLEDKHWWHISKRRAVHKLIKKYKFIENPKILDIGCGTGKNMDELRKIGPVYGIDKSANAIHYCLKRGLKNVTLGDAINTRFKVNSFDVITLLDVLEHTNDKKVLKEMQRILKENGLLIITVPAFSWLWSKWDEVLFHKRRYTKEVIMQVLKSNNFTVTFISYLYSFLVLPAFTIRKIKEMFIKDDYPSDFKLSNPILNIFLNYLSKLEFVLAQRTRIPFGTTLIVLAKKNA